MAMSAEPEHVDVLIVGAGLSGIGAAAHLHRRCPEKNCLILEARGAMGGTWDLFRYPGIRSESDRYTLGYAFTPWTTPSPTAAGRAIRDYIEEPAAEHGINRKIRYNHRAVAADWSSAGSFWRVGGGRHDGTEVFTSRSLGLD